MKLLVISQHYFPEPFSITLICEYLSKKGSDVTVITAQPSYGRSEIYDGYEKKWFEEHNGVHVIRVRTPARKKSIFSLLLNYFSFLLNSLRKVHRLKTKFDCVLSVCLSPITSVIAACVFSKRNQIPHIHYCLDVWPESAVATGYLPRKGLFYHIALSISKKIYHQCDEIVISSPCFSSYLSTVDQVPSSKILYIPQPVLDPHSDNPIPPLQAKYNFVFSGNVGTVQMVDLFISAIDLLPEDISCCLYIVGSGSCLSALISLASTIKHKERVIFTGRVSPLEAARYCQASSALLLALKPDGSTVSHTLPNKLINYLAFGKPIVSCISGDGQAVLEAAGGYILSAANVESMADSLLQVCNFSGSTLEMMGKNNRSYFLAHFSSDQVLSDFENVLKLVK